MSCRAVRFVRDAVFISSVNWKMDFKQSTIYIISMMCFVELASSLWIVNWMLRVRWERKEEIHCGRRPGRRCAGFCVGARFVHINNPPIEEKGDILDIPYCIYKRIQL